MKTKETLTTEFFDSLEWHCEREEADTFLFYPSTNDHYYARYNAYKEQFEDRNFQPNEQQTVYLQSLVAEQLNQPTFAGFDPYAEYGVKESDFLSR